MTQHNVIQRYFDELFNRGQTELVNELLHPEYVNHSPGWAGLPRGREGVALVVRAMRDAFPDLNYTIEELIEQGDAVVVRARVRGTHRGAFLGRAGSGRGLVDHLHLVIPIRERSSRIRLVPTPARHRGG